MLGLDPLKGHLTPEIKATITGSSISMVAVVILVGDDLTTAGAKCGEQTFQRPPQAAVL
jgi:hypothetical protein